MFKPAASSEVDKVEFWDVRFGQEDPLTWVTDHPPIGMTLVGTSTGAYLYSAPSTDRWPQILLNFSDGLVASSTAGVRVDAIVIYLDPNPLRDNATGPRARLAVAGGCPPGVTGVVGVSNPGARLTSELLPTGHPARGLLCACEGSLLSHRARLGSGAVDRLAAAVAAVPLSHTDGEDLMCGMGTKSYILALSYPHRADVDLWFDLMTCTSVSNGYVMAVLPLSFGPAWPVVVKLL
jgi:hypothetical protein